MSAGHLTTMLEFLTSAYAREDIRNAQHSQPMETNIGKLFSTLAWGLEIVHESAERMVLWDDLDNARGAVLDRYGANFGVERGGANDTFYRLLIKVKMIALLSGGDIDTVINAAASLFNVERAQIELQEVFPAKVWIFVDEDILDAERLEAAPLIAQLMKRITAAGVGTRIFLRAKRFARQDLYLAIPVVESHRIEADIRQVNTRASRVDLGLCAYAWEYVTMAGELYTRDVTRRATVGLHTVTAAWEFTTVTAKLLPKTDRRSADAVLRSGTTTWENITIKANTKTP